MAGGTGSPHELVSGVGDEGRAGVADECDRLAAEPSDDLLSFVLLRVVVIAAHRDLGPDVLKQLAADSCIFGEDQVGAAERLGRSRAEVAEVPDGGGDQKESGSKRVSHSRTPIFASNRSQKESSFS